MRVSSSTQFSAVFAWLLSVCLICLTGNEAHAASNSKHPIVHRVQAGQTLGMISHRWNISVSGLCVANGLDRKKPIHPGQELIVPALDDPKGEAAAKLRKRGFLDEKQRPKLLEEIERAEKAEREKAERAERAEREKAERAEKAKREKAERAKKAERAEAERAKKAERAEAERAKKAERAKAERAKKAERRKDRSARKLAGKAQRKSHSHRASRAKSSRSKVAHAKPSRRRGYVRIKSLMGSWEGYALDRRGNVTDAAKAGFRKVLRSWRTGAGADIEPRLIRMVADVSDHFGGKQIQVVSGYRPKRKTQFTPHSRHNSGEAMDFLVAGVSNEELRDYARRFSKAGVGYYPNSSFIHLDARDYRTYWIDYSGPGERPRYAHQGYKAREDKAAPPQAVKKQAPSPAPEAEAAKDAEQKSSADDSASRKVAHGDG